METCESSGVVAHGPTYFGLLGISGTNWVAYGGTEFAPTADLATFDQQVIVAMRIQSNPPDQDGICVAW